MLVGVAGSESIFVTCLRSPPAGSISPVFEPLWGLLWVPQGLSFLHFCGAPPVPILLFGRGPVLKDRFERSALGFHADVAIVPEHLLRDMAGNLHNGFIPCTAFGKLGDESVPVVVEAPRHPSLLAEVVPGRLERRDRLRGIARRGLSERKDDHSG